MQIDILQKLVNERKSTRQIGKELGLGQTSVRYWLKEYKLQTKPWNGTKGTSLTLRKCKCGETRAEKFYGPSKRLCAKCHNNYCLQKGHEKIESARQKLGCKCSNCGFDKYKCSLDFHHVDPLSKDINFNSIRGWSYKRIEAEIKKCILLCKNCHAALHSGKLKLY